MILRSGMVGTMKGKMATTLMGARADNNDILKKIGTGNWSQS